MKSLAILALLVTVCAVFLSVGHTKRTADDPKEPVLDDFNNDAKNDVQLTDSSVWRKHDDHNENNDEDYNDDTEAFDDDDDDNDDDDDDDDETENAIDDVNHADTINDDDELEKFKRTPRRRRRRIWPRRRRIWPRRRIRRRRRGRGKK